MGTKDGYKERQRGSLPEKRKKNKSAGKTKPLGDGGNAVKVFGDGVKSINHLPQGRRKAWPEHGKRWWYNAKKNNGGGGGSIEDSQKKPCSPGSYKKAPTSRP